MRGGAIGDFVVTLPVLDVLTRTFPGASVTLIGNPDILCLAPTHRSFDHNTAAMAPLFTESRALPQESRSLFADADLVVVYTTDTDGPFPGHLRRMCDDRVLIQDPRPIAGETCHISDHLLRTLSHMDSEMAESRPPSISAEAVDRTYGREMSVAAEGRSLALLHPGSGGTGKRWLLDGFLNLADSLLSVHRVGLLLGPAEEEGLAEAFIKRGHLAVRPPNLNALAGALAVASLYVGNDSGPTHMAAALGIPTVALFGPTDPRIWGPRGRRVFLVSSRNGSMSSITVAEVRKATEQILSGQH